MAGFLCFFTIFAVMSCRYHIGLLLGIAMLAACTQSVKVVGSVGTPSQELSAIDSLMWHQSDSALAMLQRFVASPQADSLDAYNGHYCQLLIAELLYKNYYAQSNREALLQAVTYFDSLVQQVPFLTARAHYINGVGYYENDSVVEACAEYLKALELMENHFEEKALTGKKAQFMSYTYNRLGYLFSEQFMMDPSIACYEKSLAYCKIEPTSSHCESNILFRIGKQYDKKNEINEAKSYYEQAIKGMKWSDGLLYRDIIASKAVCDYQLGIGLNQVMRDLRQVVAQADNETERLNRYLTIGTIFGEERNYDSALFYLLPVFQREKNVASKIQAAESMRIIYDSIGEREKADNCVRFLVEYRKTEGENKALVSKMEDMFKAYSNKKQEKQAKEVRIKFLKNTALIFAFTAVAVVLAIIVLLRLKHKLKAQQKDADRMLGETKQQHEEEMRRRQTQTEKMLEDKERNLQLGMEVERQTHRMEQAAMSGRLKRSNKELRELKEQIRQYDDLTIKTKSAASFTEEPICRLIMERVNDGQFKSKVDCAFYKQYALDKRQLLDLRVAADRHFNQFTLRLKKAYPRLTNIDIDYCCLYLLNLTHADVSALMQRAYNTVVERDSKMRKVFGSGKTLHITLMDIALN